MNLRSFTDTILLEKTDSLIKQEREILTAVLHHLREIERRRLYSALGYKSLFDFTVRKLGYPADQAYRRISAMKLLREIPAIEEKVSSGELSLTHMGLAQALFRQEKKAYREMTIGQKVEVLEKIANTSVREAERITVSLCSVPAAMKPDRVSVLTEEHVEVKFVANAALTEKIEKLKGLLAHQYPNLSLGELFEKLCDLGLGAFDPTKTAAPQKRCVKESNEKNSIKKSAAQLRRNVFAKAHSKCQKCASTYALEIDHIVPKALGGDSSEENLRILCRSCNQRAAIEKLGQRKMDRFINSKPVG